MEGEFAASNRQKLEASIFRAYRTFQSLEEGENYHTPALANMPAHYFGISCKTPIGAAITVGDSEPTFSIQSISKVVTLALLLNEGGEREVVQDIGVNATGRVFNSIEAIEASKGRNMNPMVTPGAIAVVGKVKGKDADEVWNKILTAHNAFAGRELSVDREVYKSASATNQRNRAIGMLMSEYGAFEKSPAEVVDLYTRQNSIAVSVKDLAVIAATLANAGQNPVTGEQVLSPEHVPGVLAIMATAGLYEASGRWLFETGTPAKSGVGGGIIAVSPGKFGIAAFSPRLDRAGNSVRGQAALIEIIKAAGANPYSAQPGVHRQLS